MTVVTSAFTDLFSSSFRNSFEDAIQQSFFENTLIHHILNERCIASKCLRIEKGNAVVNCVELNVKSLLPDVLLNSTLLALCINYRKHVSLPHLQKLELISF